MFCDHFKGEREREIRSNFVYILLCTNFNLLDRTKKLNLLSNDSIIIIEYVTLRDSVVAVIYNGFLNLEIEENSKVIINYYNKKNIVYLVQFS